MKRPAIILCAVGGVVMLAFFAVRDHGEDAKQVPIDAHGSLRPPSPSPPRNVSQTDQEPANVRVPITPPGTLPGSREATTTKRRSQEVAPPEPAKRIVPSISANEDRSLPTVVASALQDECRRVTKALAGNESHPREDMLVMYGRASLASGQFDIAAAAYAMFLNEFGMEHPYSKRIAMRLADCLAPLDSDSTDIIHDADGPVFRPQWRMGYAPRPEQLRLAVPAYQLAAELTSKQATCGQALLRIGWVHRALNDWDASTSAWDRCAAEAANTKAAANALWLAAENLAWTGQSAAAAERLRRFAVEYADAPRALAAADWAECLEADARRGPQWLRDPVSSLEAEIAARASARPAHEVYKSILQWLRAGGHRSAEIQVSRWACTQTDWPLGARLACHHNLVDVLLAEYAGEAERLEAAEALAQVMALAPGAEWAVPAALRRSRLLGEIGEFELADQALDEVAACVKGSPAWEPQILAESIQSLLGRGDRNQAMAVYKMLSVSYPDHELTKKLALNFSDAGEEEP